MQRCSSTRLFGTSAKILHPIVEKAARHVPPQQHRTLMFGSYPHFPHRMSKPLLLRAPPRCLPKVDRLLPDEVKHQERGNAPEHAEPIDIPEVWLHSPDTAGSIQANAGDYAKRLIPYDKCMCAMKHAWHCQEYCQHTNEISLGHKKAKYTAMRRTKTTVTLPHSKATLSLMNSR